MFSRVDTTHFRIASCTHRAKIGVYASGFITFTLWKLEYPRTEIEVADAGNTAVHYGSETAALRKRIP